MKASVQAALRCKELFSVPLKNKASTYHLHPIFWVVNCIEVYMSPITERLLDKGILVCPECAKASLTIANDGLRCAICRQNYPREENVIDFFNQYIQNTKEPDYDTLAKALIKKIDIDFTNETLSSVINIIKKAQRETSSKHLTAEATEIFRRFSMVNVDYNIVFQKHYLERVLPPNTTLFRNVRVKNSGGFPWISDTINPLHLSYHWLDQNGKVIVQDGERTRFPIEIESEREITLPLHIKTPNESGEYIIRIALVHEGVRWVEEKVLDIPVTIQKNCKLDLEYFPVIQANSGYDYGNDHAEARGLLVDFLAKNYKENITIVEIGGGMHPQSAGLSQPLNYNVDLINIDINISLLMLGALSTTLRNPELMENLCYMCCDANKLPFAELSIDGIVIFSSLHHFPDPEELLKTCKKVIKDDGFIAVMCEPVGHSLMVKETLKELEDGINEQVFTKEEYENIFRNSGLTPVVGYIDHSLKTVLKK
jgi:ubiquinone/menaquinone biosynthesis C-methylase UbiE